jgi:monofunctional biosynthetic peptidoglycan transglycosylase
MDLRQAEAEAAVRRGQAAGDSTACAGVRMDLPTCRKHIIVPLADISPDLVTAVLAAEDSLFGVRTGVDWSAMRMAAGYPRPAFEWGNGTDRADLFAVMPGLLERMNTVGPTGSLTQRVAQIVWYPAPDGLYRKFREVLVSGRLATAVPKDRLVELYLNLAEFGPGLYGAEAAAQAYFGVSAKRLSKAQAATLAATLATPRSSTPSLEPAAMRRRQALILRRLNGEAVSIPQGAIATPKSAASSPAP